MIQQVQKCGPGQITWRTSSNRIDFRKLTNIVRHIHRIHMIYYKKIYDNIKPIYTNFIREW